MSKKLIAPRQVSANRASQTEDVALRNRRLENVFENAPYIMMLVDEASRVTDINSMGVRFTNQSKDELLGLLGGEVFHCLNSFGEGGCGRTPACKFCPIRSRVTYTLQTGESIYEAEGQLDIKKDDVNITLDLRVSTALVQAGANKQVLVTIADNTQHKRAETELQRSLSELRVLYDNGLAISALREPHEIGQKIIETLSKNLSWHHIAIRLLRSGTNVLDLIAFNQPGLDKLETAEYEKRLSSIVSETTQGLSGWAIEIGQTIRTGNVHAYPQYIETFPNISSGMYVPLKIGERTIGCIAVESEKENAFIEQDERLLLTISRQTAIAFENARLYQNLQQELKERERTEEALRASLAEKEILLREVHHRVKNNLASINGLIELQRAMVENSVINDELGDLSGRIHSMALVHELLYQSEGLSRIDLKHYLETLTAHIHTSYERSPKVSLRIDADGVEMDLDNAIPCGLIVNELVTNSFKYAFPDGKPRLGQDKCEIDVSVKWDGETYTLSVSDNGVGIPDGFNWQTSPSLGLQLVTLLGQHQLKGKIELDCSAGTLFKLNFIPKIKKGR